VAKSGAARTPSIETTSIKLPPPALLDHAPRAALGAVGDVLQVRPVKGVPTFFVRLHEWGGEHSARIVHQDVDRSEALRRQSYGAFDRFSIAHVHFDAEHLAGLRLDLCGHALGPLRVALEDRYARPEGAERQRARPMPAPPPVTMATLALSSTLSGFTSLVSAAFANIATDRLSPLV